jgi:type IV secretion system protein VirB9
MTRVGLLVLAVLAMPAAAIAQAAIEPPMARAVAVTTMSGSVIPQPSQIDRRVRVVPYVDDQVVLLRGHYGYQIMLELGPDEQIENVAIGDSLAWQVTPNSRADTLFLKPLEPDADTNMVVITTRRRYAFELTAAPGFGAQDADIFYRVRFEYPRTDAEAAAAAASSAPLVATNVAYVAAGSEATMPAQVFDDGRNTYFQFPPDAALPAIFARDSAGTETLVNFTMRGPVMVIQQLAPSFVLRNGADETVVRNDGWVAPLARAAGDADPAVAAPRIEPAPRRGFWQGLFGDRGSRP